ncbi:CU044_2847 family protein [Streptomyces sp. NPDC059786]|uniref:CU044_2847 family protein n=1 Tax=Streptomyces sp. NPDC059786 TaxID=3346946 RepID=UPI00365C35DE
MVYLVELPLDGPDGPDGPDGQPGRTVKVAIEERPGDGLVQVARPGQVVARGTRSLGELLAAVRPVAGNFVDTFRGMARGPDEISLEFGLSLSAEADVVISSTSAQANFAVRLTWDQRATGDASASGGDPVPPATPARPA